MLGKKLIVMCNSELDGFNEGDGDLLQRLVSEFSTDDRYVAKRMVYQTSQVPDSLLNSSDLHILGNTEKPNKDDFSKRLFGALQSYEDYPYKIFYIASRFDKAEVSETGAPYLYGSGSFFTKDIIFELQRRNFKVVVCCLEFKFFRRSAKYLMHAAVMLKEQLFYADAVQFMNQLDRADFDHLIDQFRYSMMLEPIDNTQTQHPEYQNNQRYFDFTQAIHSIGGVANLGNMINKGRHIPGTYTVVPMSLEEVTFSDLLYRPNNLLCFGLIRGKKGVFEAVDIAKELQKRRDARKVFIVGKVIGSLSLFKSIIMQVYGIRLTKLSKLALELLKGYELNVPIAKFESDGVMSFEDVEDTIFQGGVQDFSLYCGSLLTAVDSQIGKEKKLENVDIRLNLTPDELKNIAMQCQYAIKLDHKGMADNASSIVSCLGMFLPTFTACGLVTDERFRHNEVHKIDNPTATSYLYSEVVIMPPENYDKDSGELLPINFTPQKICDTIQSETCETYRKRIRKLFELRESGFYDIQVVKLKLDDLIKDMFPALIEEAISEEAPPPPTEYTNILL